MVATDTGKSANARKPAKRLSCLVVQRALAAMLSLYVSSLAAFVTPPDDPPPIDPPAEPENCLFGVYATLLSAAPTTLTLGQSTTLSWAVNVPNNCSGLTLSLAGQPIFGSSGTLLRTPSANATYQMRAMRYGTVVDLASVSVNADSLAYTTAYTPVCTASQIANHDFVRNKQSGVDVVSPNAHFIGSSEADGDLYRNWAPIDQYKHTLCGTLHHYGFFVAPWFMDGDEADSNMHIVPNAEFKNLIDDPIALGISPPGAVNKCGFIQCMEGEITPDDSEATNSFFPPYEGSTSSLVGKTMCAYGPWIADHGHDRIPEIHPTEARWWSTTPTPALLFREVHVNLAQDDSNRFDDRVSDFVPDMPSSLKPWSSAPMTAAIRYAFLVPQTGGTEEFLHVWPVIHRNVSQVFDDVSSSLQHTLTFNGLRRFTIVENTPGLEGNLGVGFDDNLSAAGAQDVCRRSNGYIQGYALLRSQYGLNNSGGEGYQQIRLRHSRSPTDSLTTTQVADQAKAIAIPDGPRALGSHVDGASLHLVTDARGTRLVGDIVVALPSSAAIVGAQDGAGNKVSMLVERNEKRVGANLVRLRDLDLSSSSQLSATFADGKSASGRLPGLGVAVELETKSKAANASDSDLDAAWKSVTQSLGAKSVVRPAEFSYLARWDVTATPQFAAIKDGEISREDEYEVAKLLNSGMENQHASFVLTLARAISSLQWVVDGEKSGARSSEFAYSTEFQKANYPRTRSITVNLRDVFGGRMQRNVSIYSHGLVGADLKQVRQVVAQMVGMDVATLKAPAASDPAEAHFAPSASDRGLLSQLLAHSVRDGVVTPDELDAQLRVARRLRQP